MSFKKLGLLLSFHKLGLAAFKSSEFFEKAQFLTNLNFLLSYLAPPPSRPRYNDFEVTNSIEPDTRRYDVFPSTNYNYNSVQYNPVQSQVISYQPSYQPRFTNTAVTTTNVPSLSIKYIPNVGWRYYAVVPIDYLQQSQQLQQQPVTQSTKQVDKYAYAHEKLGGKYNPKLKKYKVYEKKYVPSVSFNFCPYFLD